jgi:hypothetical protein
LVVGLEDMGESITTLESTLRKTERENRLLKYGLGGMFAAVIVEAIIIAVK